MFYVFVSSSLKSSLLAVRSICNIFEGKGPSWGGEDQWWGKDLVTHALHPAMVG